MIVLGIETSCDDTAAAVLAEGSTVLANVVWNQDLIHRRFGGIVPELASRRHMESITLAVDEALGQAGCGLTDLDLIAVTRGPGLIGSLLVGFTYAKSVSYALGIPYVGVDHMAGHLLSAFLEAQPPPFPYLALIVSGGTTSLFTVDGFDRFSRVGSTRDDAAGEAFDKLSRYLQLGYPGGPAISRLAESGAPEALAMPRARLEEGSLDFSFSGLKTAALNHCNRLRQRRPLDDAQIGDICASFQQAIIDVLVDKTLAAADRFGLSTVVLGGGVAANRELRHRMAKACEAEGLLLHLPRVEHCTDNGAMIAFAGAKLHEAGGRGGIDDDVYARSPLGR